ncbi:hypothetical protein CEXT_15191 [Caerostris extrusa]|uniref:Uncharacterized protein n=1 Tax=Caerostris extrusa TaxID=172846 RepID=A0AAV4WZ31_CAEEX|nr:hypothetical protein CEXT_15191 [Caerostris extrusa]
MPPHRTRNRSSIRAISLLYKLRKRNKRGPKASSTPGVVYFRSAVPASFCGVHFWGTPRREGCRGMFVCCSSGHVSCSTSPKNMWVERIRSIVPLEESFGRMGSFWCLLLTYVSTNRLGPANKSRIHPAVSANSHLLKDLRCLLGIVRNNCNSSEI